MFMGNHNVLFSLHLLFLGRKTRGEHRRPWFRWSTPSNSLAELKLLSQLNGECYQLFCFRTWYSYQ